MGQNHSRNTSFHSQRDFKILSDRKAESGTLKEISKQSSALVLKVLVVLLTGTVLILDLDLQ